MKIVTAGEMRRVDRLAVQKFGIPALILMENAAICSAFCALRMLKKGEYRVALLCGQGNNGGDGFACARHLLNRGLQIKVFFAGEKDKLSLESRTNWEILRKMGQKILPTKISMLEKELQDADLIIDALVGIGLKNKVRPPLYNLIKLLNQLKKPVLSLDIPSGMDANSGRVRGIAVRAQHTVTFGLFKNGFLNPAAKEYTGKITVGDISLPRKLLY